MAKILFTAVVADMRNKLNGTVFSKNRYGAYARTKVTPVNPQTVAQQNNRNQLATFSAAWRGITQSQREGWISAAANFPTTDIFGNAKILSGNALFVGLNKNLDTVGVAQIDDAPTPVALPAITALSLAAAEGAGTVAVTFAPTPVPADFAFIVYATPNVPPGRLFVKNLYRTVTVLDAAATSPAAIGVAYAAIHGAPVAGQTIFIKVVAVSKTTGQSGVPVYASAVVAA